MTKIFTPTDLLNCQFPDSVERIKDIGREVNTFMEISSAKGDIIGATSYGSMYDPNSLLTRTSDVDWLIIFKDLESIFGSEELKLIIKALKNAHITFSSPILSLETIESGNHLIGPIQRGIKGNIHRVIIGKDPIQILNEKNINPDNLNIIKSMFSSYPRYLYEAIFTGLGEVNNPEFLVSLIQKAVDYFTDTYRTMIVLSREDESSSNIMSYGTYSINFANKIERNALVAGENINRFINEYKGLVEDIMSEMLSEESFEKKQNLVNQYRLFLSANIRILINSIIFCQKNIEYFDKSINQTK